MKQPIKYTHQFLKEWEQVQRSDLAGSVKELVLLVEHNPFQTPPPYEKLKGYKNVYSRRINRQHRLVYIVRNEQIVFLRCWGALQIIDRVACFLEHYFR